MAAATLETAAMMPVAAQRLPSTRPLDQRWDRSRGIIFNNAKRVSTIDRTWSSSSTANGTPFTDPPASRRFYAVNRIGGTRPAESKAESFVDNSHRMSGFRMSPKEMEDQQKRIKQLENDVATRDVLIKNLQSDLSKKEQELQREIASKSKTAAEGAREVANLRQQLKAEKQERRADVERLQRESAQKDARHQQDIALRDTSSHTRFSEQEVKHRHELEHLRQLSATGLASNQPILDAARKEGEASAKVRFDEELRKKEETHALELKRESEHGANVRMLQNELDLLRRTKQRDELHYKSELRRKSEGEVLQRDRANQLATTNAQLQRSLDGRHARADHDRLDYTEYREIFAEASKHLSQSVLPKTEELMDALNLEAKLWRASESRLSNVLKNDLRFRSFSRRPALKQSILDFLNMRASQAQSAASTVGNVRAELKSDLAQFSRDSHGSRDLTRLLHFDEQLDLEGVNHSHYLSNMRPLMRRRDEEQAHIDALREEYANASGSRALELNDEIMNAIRRAELLQRQIDHFDAIRKTENIKAVMHSPPVEKRIYIHTHKLRRRLLDVAAAYTRALKESKDHRQRIVLRAEERKVRAAFGEQLRHIRRVGMYEQELGESDPQVEKDFDAMVGSKLEEAKLLERRTLDVLVGERETAATTRRKRMSVSTSAATPAATIRTAGSTSTLVRKQLSFSSFHEDRARRAIAKAGSVDAALDVYQRNIENLRKAHPTKTVLSNIKSLQAILVELEKLKSRRFPNEESPATQGELPDGRGEPPDSGANTAASASISTGSLRAGRRRRKRLNVSAGTAPRFSIESLRQSLGSESSPGVLNMAPTQAKKAALHLWPSTLGRRHFSSSISPRRQEVRWSTLNQALGSGSDIATDIPISTLSYQAAVAVPAPPARNDSAGLNSPAAHVDRHEDGFSTMASTPGQITSCFASSDDAEADSSLDESKLSDALSEPDTELTYQIPAKDYRDAVMASDKSSAAYWSHTLYKSPEGAPVKVFYCKSLETAERQLKLFVNEPVLGFDLEWEQYAKPHESPIKQNISLVQIATEDKICLVHLACFTGDTPDDLMPESLRKIIESPNIAKAGVNIAGDARRIRQCFGIDMQGVFELSHMYRLVKYSQDQPKDVNFKMVNLAQQVHEVLLLPLLKSDVRVSAWSRPLNQQQTTYAAADAYAGFRLYHKLDSQRKHMKPKPPRPAYFETGQPIVLGNGDVIARSKNKSRDPSKKTVAGAAAAAEEGEEDEEFFDALEELPDTYELDAGATYTQLPITNAPAADAAGPEDADSAQATATSAPQAASIPASTTNSNKPQTLRSDETVLADEWARSIHTSSSRVGPATLRAYHLWHHQNFGPQKVAALCREPPLAITTVASYVMQAVKEENLEYEGDRLKEVLEILPKSVWGYYGKWVKEVGLKRE